MRTIWSSATTGGNQTAETLFGHMRDGAYDQLYSEAAPEFQKVTSKEKMVSLMKTVDRRPARPPHLKIIFSPRGRRA